MQAAAWMNHKDVMLSEIGRPQRNDYILQLQLGGVPSGHVHGNSPKTASLYLWGDPGCGNRRDQFILVLLLGEPGLPDPAQPP